MKILKLFKVLILIEKILLGIDLKVLFKEYINKNISTFLFQNSSPKNEIKIYLKTNNSKKSINKNIIIQKMNQSKSITTIELFK